MQTNQRSILPLFFLLFLTFLPLQLQAVHTSTKPLNHDQTNMSQTKRPQEGGVLKKWKTNLIAKKIQKLTQKSKIDKQSKIALFIGIASMLCLILALPLATLFLLIPAAGFAIAGDILSISTLIKIKKSDNPVLYKEAKNKAIWGLVFSLLTGVIPLILLILVFVFAA